MQKKLTLEKIYDDFCSKTGYRAVFGIEQEFYLHFKEGYVNSAPNIAPQAVIDSLAAFPFFSEIEEEKGEGQFEVQIAPTNNPALMAQMVELLRKNIILSADNAKIRAEDIFAAKPYIIQPGSGMHIHINLLDENGQNIFSRNGDDESEEFHQAIAGLLELMPASIKYFAPYEAAYVRYVQHGMDCPSTISWGANNRTASLRLPSVPLMPHTRRIEHRVPCADADPYLCIAAILIGIEFGILNKLENKHPKIWGNAFLPQYQLAKLPHSLNAAKAITHEYLDKALSGFFSDLSNG
jgi:glutamine synthetase